VDHSQRQHSVAKGVARRGARIIIFILGVIKCKVAGFRGIYPTHNLN